MMKRWEETQFMQDAKFTKRTKFMKCGSSKINLPSDKMHEGKEPLRLKQTGEQTIIVKVAPKQDTKLKKGLTSRINPKVPQYVRSQYGYELNM